MGKSIDPSLFAAIRATVCFILADRKIHPKERAWFLTMLDGHGLTADQRALLDRDFEKPPKLEEVFLKIHEPGDRDRLIAWAKRVIEIDGEVPQSERVMFQHLLELNLSQQAPDSELKAFYREYAKELMSMEDRGRMWKELEDFGRQLNKRPVLTPFGLYFPMGHFREMSVTSRFFLWFGFFLAVAAIAARILIRKYM